MISSANTNASNNHHLSKKHSVRDPESPIKAGSSSKKRVSHTNSKKHGGGGEGTATGNHSPKKSKASVSNSNNHMHKKHYKKTHKLDKEAQFNGTIVKMTIHIATRDHYLKVNFDYNLDVDTSSTIIEEMKRDLHIEESQVSKVR